MSEQEKFYHEANEFIDRDRTTLLVGEFVAKFLFWRKLFTSKFGGNAPIWRFAILVGQAKRRPLNPPT
jgi:hypothetical protein